jgi:fermentation-respiration switch protein FrsA (DUF1100 family)
MIIRTFSLFAAIALPVWAQNAVPETAAEIREALEDRDGNLTRLAGELLGKKGGNHLFYLPTRDQPATPAKWGFRYEDVTFTSADGTGLHGWFLPGRGKQTKGTIVFSHGNAGSIGHHLGFVMWLVEAHYNVLMYDYRGFGKSGGTVDRRGMLDDVSAAFTYVASRADVNPKRLISYGHSLGGAKSVTALAENRVSGLRAVIIDGAFSSYQAMARIVAGQVGANLVNDEWSPGSYVEKLAPVPLLVVHGTQDEVVPVAHARQMFDAAKEPKTFFEVRNGRHGNALSCDNGAYRKKMLTWLETKVEG